MEKELSAKQIKAISLLATGTKSKDVAAELEVTAQTICEWWKQPSFAAEVNRIKWESLIAAREMIRASAGLAVQNLAEIATSAENEETRRKACNDLINLTGLSDPTTGLYGWGLE